MIVFYLGMEYIVTCIDMIMCCIFCGTFLWKEKISEKKGLIVLLSLFSSFIICLFNNIRVYSYLNIMAVTLLMVYFQWMIYKKTLLLSLMFTLIYASMLNAINFFSVSIFSLKMHIDSLYLLNVQSIFRVKVLFLSKIILVLVITTICKASRVKKYTFSQKYMTFMSICSVFAFVCNLIIMQEDLSNGEMKGIIFFTILIIEFFIIYCGSKLSENCGQQQQMEVVKLRNEMLQKSLDNTEHALQSWRASIHDYKNHVIVLSQLSQDGKLEEIRDYLKQQNKLLDQKVFYIKTGNSAVDAIINAKKNLADQQNIVFYVNAVILEECIIKPFDIVSILGNLIDNALEACAMESSPYIDISIKEEKNFLIIRVINSFTGELPRNMQTTKSNKMWHGIGMENIKNIVEKYNGDFDMVHKNNEVATHVMLLNKELE
ncbi:MAG: GHKL domain-containing protein [Lachnospiraceae bacterium]|nr:GHKL domain-containing protein [Lachnospiraceae bacterium]